MSRRGSAVDILDPGGVCCSPHIYIIYIILYILSKLISDEAKV